MVLRPDCGLTGRKKEVSALQRQSERSQDARGGGGDGGGARDPGGAGPSGGRSASGLDSSRPAFYTNSIEWG